MWLAGGSTREMANMWAVPRENVRRWVGLTQSRKLDVVGQDDKPRWELLTL